MACIDDFPLIYFSFCFLSNIMGLYSFNSECFLLIYFKFSPYTARDFASADMIGAMGLNGKSWPDLDMLPLGWLTDPGEISLASISYCLTHISGPIYC